MAAVAPITTDHTGAHPETESWLDSLHVAWTFVPALPLADIDRAAGVANQARLQALDDDVVDRYADCMTRGDTFPPVLLNRRNRKLVPLGGNHRLAGAHQAKKSTISAYLIEVAPEMATRLMYEDNRRHGLPPSEDERLAQAVHLINTGYSPDDAAAVVGVSKSKVDRARQGAAADTRARQLHLPGWDRLPRTTRWRLGMLRSDPVFTQAATLLAAAALPAGAVFDMVTQLNKTRSDAEALAVLEQLAEEHQARIQNTAGGKATRATPRSKLIGVTTQIAGVDPGRLRASCVDADQRRDLARRCMQASDQLADLAKKLAAAR